MPKKQYKTKVTRVTTETLTVTVEAENKQMASEEIHKLIDGDKINFADGASATINTGFKGITMIRQYCCPDLQDALTRKHESPVFYDLGSECGVDTSAGNESCMDSYGLTFKFCPFCGSDLKDVLGG